MKILIIDDEENLRRLVCYNLTREGHEVLMAEDGEQGLAMAAKHRLDLILLDIMMPGINGLDLCLKLKTEPQTKDLVVFMFTAKGKIEDIENAFEFGADNYITKPFPIEKLNDFIQLKLSKLKNRNRKYA